MKFRNALVAALAGLLVTAFSVTAQTNRPRPGQRPAPKTTTPAKPTPTPAQRPASTPAPPQGALAVVNGQPVTLADLEPQVREAVEGFDKRMPELRRDALEARVNTLLLEAEAQKRKVTGEQLMDAEVNNRITEPTDAEVRAVYDANRQQIGDADLAAVRPQIVSYLRNQAAQKLAGEFVKRLRSSHSVTMGPADINATNLPPSAVLATVNGKPVTSGDFEERLKPFVYRLRREIFEAQARAVDTRINQMLLEAEAKRRGKAPEQMYKEEVEGKVREPTEAEVAKFYADNRSRIQGDLQSLRGDIAALLKSQQLNRLEAEFAQRLRAGATVQVFIKEPEQPVQAVSADDDPARGEAGAPVTVVMFTDFQCPSCATLHPVVEETLKPYGGRVRLVVRDFPLSVHAHARKAAEAAGAAHAQGKFFEYIALLYKNQSALDVASLKKYASDLGLDRARFDAALDGGQHAAEVARDISDGEAYGVSGTPTLFINGVMLRNLTAEGLRSAIEAALAKGAPAAKRAGN